MAAGLKPIKLGASCAALAICMMACAAAQAQVIVLQSTVSKYKSGSTLGKATNVAVPAGGMILVVLPSGVTRTINGPFNGKVAALSKGGGRSNAALFNAVKKYVKTGGASTKTVGAMRSIAPQRLPTFSWAKVPLKAEGDICIARGDSISITRMKSAKSLSVTVIDLSSTQRAKVAFAAGQYEASWPAELPLKNSNYALIPVGKKMRQVRVRLIAPIPTADQTLQVLHGQRCNMQFAEFLRGFAQN